MIEPVEESAEATRLVAGARGLRRSRSGEKSRNLLNRALSALNKDPHLVAQAATALSPSRLCENSATDIW